MGGANASGPFSGSQTGPPEAAFDIVEGSVEARCRSPGQPTRQRGFIGFLCVAPRLREGASPTVPGARGDPSDEIHAPPRAAIATDTTRPDAGSEGARGAPLSFLAIGA